MSKRRKESDGVELGYASSSKRFKRIGANTAPTLEQILRWCQELLDYLRSYRTIDGRLLSETFIRAPSRRTMPDYFKAVKQPIDITRIQQKIKTEEYDSFDAFCADIALLIDNAKVFYKTNSTEYKDACDIWELFVARKAKMLDATTDVVNSKEPSPVSSIRSVRSNSPSRSNRSKETSPGRLSAIGGDPVDASILEDLLASVLELTDEHGRLLSPPFRILMSQEEFPDYYDMIKEPIDLKTIAQRIRSGHYRTLNDIEKDLKLLCRNAKMYNEPGATIHKDATSILKFISKRKNDLLEHAARPIESTKADRNTEILDELLRQSLSEDGDVEYSEDSDEDGASEHSSDPRWVLYWTVRNYTTSNNPSVALAEPFCQLPSRSWYPDYYDEVPEPMSLFMINKKLKRNEYDSLLALLKDINLIFINARSYNIEGSEIYASACRLETVANQKAKDLDPSIDITQFGTSDVDAYRADASTPASMASSTNQQHRSKMHHHHHHHGDGRGKPGRKTLDELMQRYRDKLLQAWNTVHNYKDETGRWVAEFFMSLPSRKLYPDYYKIIPDPVDMAMIKDNILNDKYDSSEDLTADFDLLFANARHYNEESSQIYKDAEKLEHVFGSALKGLGPIVLESPKLLKEKFGWCKIRALGTDGPSHKLYRTTAANRATSPTNNATPSGITVSATDTPRRSQQLTAEQNRMWSLFTTIKEYHDARGRQLCRAFLKLPLRTEYPDYYEVIRKPMDLCKIGNRMSMGHYDGLDALFQDFVLMFDNACRYNEPESIIYKDALSLSKILLQKKNELSASDHSTIPNVQTAVQELMMSLFITVNNHQDADGRCYSDSLAELPDMLKKSDGAATNTADVPLTFDQIKSNLDRGRYRRLDRFQDDIFRILDRARQVSRSDSQLFEDALELQIHFIRTRDELCKGVMISPARYIHERHVNAMAEQLRKEKLPLETAQDAINKEGKQQLLGDKADGDTVLESVDHGGEEYSAGDYVYIEPADEKNAQTQPHIMRLERMWTNADGQRFVRGLWFYRPHETFHLRTRKFLKNELFMTTYFDTVTVDRLIGKCYVMFVRDYFKFRPKNIDDAHIYVCESRYLGRLLHFKKIKHWPYPREESGIEFESRNEPLTNAVRVASEFADQPLSENIPIADEDIDDAPQDESMMMPLEKEREEVLSTERHPNANCVYYEQLRYGNLWLRLGNAVYVNSDEHKEHPDIVRIDKLWRDDCGNSFLSGPWFARPDEIEHEPTRMFYKRELFGTEQPDTTVSLAHVKGICSVLALKDFCSMRPTEIREENVYIVQYKILGRDAVTTNGQQQQWTCSLTNAVAASSLQSHADDDDASAAAPPNVQSPTMTTTTSGQPMSESSARKLKILKTYNLSAKVLEDEIYLFRKPITPEKEMSPLLMKTDTDVIDDLFVNDLEETSPEVLTVADAAGLTSKELNIWLAGQPKLNSRSKSGYILFSAEIRKRIMHENPNATFGEISKKVGVEWKKLTEDDKKQFESRAQYIAEEREKADALAPPANTRLQPGQIRVHCCKWSGCDHQFDSQDALYEHIKTMHTSQIVDGENQYVCLWMSCLKYRKDGKPFPSLPRLHRHIKEKHLGTAAKSIFLNQISKHYYGNNPQSPSTPNLQQQQMSGHYLQQSGQHGGQTPVVYTTTSTGGYVQQQTPMHQNHQSSIAAVDMHGNPVTIVQSHHAGSGGTIAIGAPNAIHMTAGGQQQYMTQQQQQQQISMSGGSMSINMQHHQQQSFPTTDPGKTIVHSKSIEPVFVAPPNSVPITRALHSEIYLRYIESLGDDRQRTVSKWDRSLNANRRNTTATSQSTSSRTLSSATNNWFATNDRLREDDLVKCLWNLRDRLIEQTTNIAREIDATDW